MPELNIMLFFSYVLNIMIQFSPVQFNTSFDDCVFMCKTLFDCLGQKRKKNTNT